MHPLAIVKFREQSEWEKKSWELKFLRLRVLGPLDNESLFSESLWEEWRVFDNETTIVNKSFPLIIRNLLSSKFN